MVIMECSVLKAMLRLFLWAVGIFPAVNQDNRGVKPKIFDFENETRPGVSEQT